MTMQEHIDEVMDNFDFGTVKRVMDMLGWKWAKCGGVPEVADMRRHVRSEIKRMWEWAEAERRNCWTDSGGFVVTVERHRDGMNVRVQFVAADYESAPDPGAMIAVADAREGGGR